MTACHWVSSILSYDPLRSIDTSFAKTPFRLGEFELRGLRLVTHSSSVQFVDFDAALSLQLASLNSEEPFYEPLDTDLQLPL